VGVEGERPLCPSDSGGRQELLVLDEWKTAHRRLTTALRKIAEEKTISTSPFVSESDLRLELGRLDLLVEKVENAIVLARQAHQEHLRDDGSPYLEEHVFAVALETARFLADHTVDGSPVDAVAAALLHDVLEDQGSARVLDLKKTFGQEVSSIVQLLTKEQASQQNELDSDLEREEGYIRRVGSGPPIARVVKVFDRLNNLACLHKSTPSKRARYIEETRRFHLPLARELDPTLAEAMEARLQELSTELESGT
jgi:(p)ppGpp synthase/HD superfamily hydrolase